MGDIQEVRTATHPIAVPRVASSSRLYHFELARHVHGTRRWADFAAELFVPGNGLLFGDWDVLRISADSEGKEAREGSRDDGKPKLSRLRDRRITSAFGPIFASEGVASPDAGFAWPRTTDDLPLFAYVELRLCNWALEHGDGSTIRQAAEFVRQQLQMREPSVAHAGFLSLSHHDVTLLLMSKSLDDLLSAVVLLRSATLEMFANCKQCGLSQPIRDALRTKGFNHLFQETYTIPGFFAAEAKDLLTLAKSTSRKEALFSPTVLFRLFPGHEAALDDLMGLLEIPACETTQDFSTGALDLRLKIVPEKKARTQRENFEGVLRIYHRLATGIKGAEHVSHVLTQWGMRLQQVPVAKLQKHEALPPLEMPRLPRDAGDDPAFGSLVTSTPQWLLDTYHALSSLPAYETFLHDVGQFLCALRDVVLAEFAPMAKPWAWPPGFDRLTQRLHLAVIERTAGGCPSLYTHIAAGPLASGPKAAIALTRICRSLATALGNATPEYLSTRLVSVSPVSSARTTRWHQERRSPGLVLYEVPLTSDLRDAFFAILHEVGHSIRLTPVPAEAIEHTLLAEFASKLARLLLRSDDKPELMEFVTPEQAQLADQLFDLLVEEAYGKRGVPRDESAGSTRAREVISALGSPNFLLHLVLLLAGEGGRGRDAHLVPGDVHRLQRIATEMHKFSSIVETLFSELRADVCASTLCGWRAYRVFLIQALEAHRRGVGDGEHGRARISCLRAVGSVVCPEELDDGDTVLPLGSELRPLVDALEGLAQQLKDAVAAQSDVLADLRSLLEQVASSGGAWTDEIAWNIVRLFELQVGAFAASPSQEVAQGA